MHPKMLLMMTAPLSHASHARLPGTADDLMSPCASSAFHVVCPAAMDFR